MVLHINNTMSRYTITNFPAELHSLILISTDFVSLVRLRQTCRQLLANPLLLKNFQSQETLKRFEKIVFTAKPFFPTEMRSRDFVFECVKCFKEPVKEIFIGSKFLGMFVIYATIPNGKYVYGWTIAYALPKKWCDFIISSSVGFFIKKFVSVKIDIYFKNNQLLVWTNKCNNLSEMQTQFWAVHKIVHTQLPAAFFASDQTFF